MIGYAIEVHRQLSPGLLESAHKYLKLAGVKTGLLINFNNTKLKDGMKLFVF